MVEIAHNEYEENGLIVKAVKSDNKVSISIRDIITQESLYSRDIKTFNAHPTQIQIEDMVDDALFIYQNRKAFKRKDQMNEIK